MNQNVELRLLCRGKPTALKANFQLGLGAKSCSRLLPKVNKTPQFKRALTGIKNGITIKECSE